MTQSRRVEAEIIEQIKNLGKIYILDDEFGKPQYLDYVQALQNLASARRNNDVDQIQAIEKDLKGKRVRTSTFSCRTLAQALDEHNLLNEALVTGQEESHYRTFRNGADLLHAIVFACHNNQRIGTIFYDQNLSPLGDFALKYKHNGKVSVSLAKIMEAIYNAKRLAEHNSVVVLPHIAFTTSVDSFEKISAEMSGCDYFLIKKASLPNFVEVMHYISTCHANPDLISRRYEEATALNAEKVANLLNFLRELSESEATDADEFTRAIDTIIEMLAIINKPELTASLTPRESEFYKLKRESIDNELIRERLSAINLDLDSISNQSRTTHGPRLFDSSATSGSSTTAPVPEEAPSSSSTVSTPSSATTPSRT